METNKEVPQKQTNKKQKWIYHMIQLYYFLVFTWRTSKSVSQGYFILGFIETTVILWTQLECMQWVWIRNVPHRFRHFNTCPPGDWHCFRRFQRCSLLCWRRGGLRECIQKFQNLVSLLWNMGLSNPCHHVSPSLCVMLAAMPSSMMDSCSPELWA